MAGLQKRSGIFKFTGVNQAGAEFSSGTLPGRQNYDYVWPKESSIDTLMDKGFNTFRIPLLMERLVPTNLTGTADAAYLASLESTVSYITGKGAYAVIDAHNYGRYYSNIITDVSGFKQWWKTVATPFKDNALVVFDTNNEYHDMDNSLVQDLNQAAIDGIRAVGATSQYIFVEGNAWSGAYHWISSGTSTYMANLTDPSDKLVYEMHQYLDSDASGTSSTCVSSTIGSERLATATAWLRAQGKVGVIGEMAGGANSQCVAAVQDMLSYMQDNSDVWKGWIWWSAGPWWGSYMYSMEPTTGLAYTGILPNITQYI